MSKSEEMEITDSALLQNLRNGDQTAFRKVYQQYYPMIAKLVSDNNGSAVDAEDIFQETMFCFLKKLNDPEFKLTSKMSTYLYSIGNNLWLQRLAKTARRKEVPVEDFGLLSISEPDDAQWRSEWEHHLAIVSMKLQELESDCRRLLTLTFFEKRSHNEIAELMQYQVSFVKVKKHRCLEYLRRSVLSSIHLSA